MLDSKQAYAYIENNRGHIWELNKEGTVAIFAYNPYDPHNGPKCVVCGYGFCHHCQELPDIDCWDIVFDSDK